MFVEVYEYYQLELSIKIRAVWNFQIALKVIELQLCNYYKRIRLLV